jgi:hypothetical protein
VRAGVPERVAMQMTGHKTRSVFERYNIVNEFDLVDAAKKLNVMQPMVRLKPDTTDYSERHSPTDSDHHGHNLGTLLAENDSRRSMSL